MSGFLGVYRQDGASFDQRLLDGILQRLRCRGPDARNIFVERDFACSGQAMLAPTGCAGWKLLACR
jgi:asparagine synthetase B (glutamine-hydrolysing)